MTANKVIRRNEKNFKKMRIGLSKAKAIIDYCGGGDMWERECNKEDMNTFDKICNELGIE